MHLVDTIKCVSCNAIEYVKSKGRSSRTFNAVCEKCDPKGDNLSVLKVEIENAAKKNEPGKKSA